MHEHNITYRKGAQAQNSGESLRRMKHEDDQLLIDVKTAAVLLGDVSPRTIWNLIARGDLKPVRVLRRVLFRRSDLEKFAARGTR